MSKIIYKCQKECYWAYQDTTSKFWKLGEEVEIDSKSEIKPPKHFVLKEDWKDTSEEKKMFRRNRVIGQGGRQGAETFTDFAKQSHLIPEPIGMNAGVKQEENVIPVRKGRTK